MDFAALITPNDPAFLTAAREIHAEREDLQQAFPDREGREYRKWLTVSGALEYPERIGRFFPPLPAEDLRRTGCGGTEARGHLLTAIQDFEILWELWRLCGDRPFGELRDVLDFGCGCGRVSRWFADTLPAATTHGCDVRAAGIDWCREHLRGDFQTNATTPPLPWADDSMDLVFALSLFSHFDRESSVAWIRELARVCRPDGRLIVTTHGQFSTWVISRLPEYHATFRVTPKTSAELARQLQREDFVFHQVPARVLEALDGPSADYGQAYATERFVREAWGAFVEVEAFVPAALHLFQDAYVLRPRR